MYLFLIYFRSIHRQFMLQVKVLQATHSTKAESLKFAKRKREKKGKEIGEQRD